MRVPNIKLAVLGLSVFFGLAVSVIASPAASALTWDGENSTDISDSRNYTAASGGVDAGGVYVQISDNENLIFDNALAPNQPTTNAGTLVIIQSINLSVSVTVNVGSVNTTSITQSNGTLTASGTIGNLIKSGGATTLSGTLTNLDANNFTGIGSLTVGNIANLALSDDSIFFNTTSIGNITVSGIGTSEINDVSGFVLNAGTINMTTAAQLNLPWNITLGGNRLVTGSSSAIVGFGEIGGPNTLDTNGFNISVASVLVFIDSDLIGSGSLSATNSSATIALYGDNGLYDGNLNASGGWISINTDTAFGSTVGDTTVTSGGVLYISSALTPDTTITEQLILNGPGSGAFKALDVNVASTLSGTVNLASNAEIGTTEAVTMSGVISGPGGLLYEDKSGTEEGSLKLTADNTYTGITTAGRKLIINGNQPSSPVVVPSGAALYGTGTVDTIDIANGGRLAPGESPGCMNSGDVTFAIGATFDVEMAGPAVCSQYDQLRVTGSIDLNGTSLNPNLLSGYVPAVGDVYVFITNDGTDKTVNGSTFVGLNEGATFDLNGTIFRISYLGGDGNDITLTAMPAGTAVTGSLTAPDTGFGNMLTANPLLTAAVTLVSTVGIVLIARRFKTAV